jgi:mercuric ion binding protein
MKKLILIAVILIETAAFSQNKNAKASLEVNGVCSMCKSRIEKASLNTKGVKSANWDMKTHELRLIYDARKTNLETIEKNVVAVGHDTKNLKAVDGVYESINGCCQYRDPAVVDAH